MTHFYSTFNYPAHDSYVDTDGKLRKDLRVGYDIRTDMKRILVAGCGTIEAAIIKQQAPWAEVIGVDTSLPSIEKCRALLNKSEISGVELIHADLKDFKLSEPVDCVTASGVLHHIPEVDVALANIKSNMNHGAVFFGMVYPTLGREHILETIKNFSHFPKDMEGVAMVKQFFADLNDEHPSKKWWGVYEHTTEEIADTWLNPYFKHYDMDSLYRLVVDSGFAQPAILYQANKMTFATQLL
jgi:SAM-dependent methyltransferase